MVTIKKHFITLGIVGFFVFLSFILTAQAQQPQLPPPETTDPIKLELMKGFPPPPEKVITFANSGKYPHHRWTFHHLRQLFPTVGIWRGRGEVTPLPSAPRDLDGISFDDDKGQKITVAEWQKATYTDALLVLHKGGVAYERYYVGMRSEQQHILWSVTKSFTGTLTTLLIQEGKLDPNAKVPQYVPELADTAWGDATVQQTLDMTAGVRYREVYTDPTTEVFQYAFATGMLPLPPNYPGPKTLYEFLKSLKKEGEHGAGFQYKTVNSEVLGWILRRATGKSFADLMSERIWSQIGAEEDAYAWVDSIGTELMGAGLNATLRDLGRFGEMMRLGGMINGKRVLPSAVVDEIRKGADREKFKASGFTVRFGYSYHNQWWIPHDIDGTYEAKGIHGQHIHINPAAELVLVKISSSPVASTNFTQVLDRNAFQAIASALRTK